MFNILKNSRNILIRIRGSLKFIILLIIATTIIVGILSLIYKKAYSVTLNGEFIGYTTNKSKLQNKISNYIKKGDGDNDNIAFVDIDTLPEYSLCLLKKDSKESTDEIFEKVRNSGTVNYEYYAIVLKNEEKNYVKTKEEAEDIINKLKEKKSANIDDIAYTSVHSTQLKDFTDTDTVITALYEKKKDRIVVAAGNGLRGVGASAPSLSTIGVSLATPVSGVITSRFGVRGSETHTGLDIAAPTGTTIRAAASGTVTVAGPSGSGYGLYVKILHGNGVETLYAHCSSIYVTPGQYVSQGEAIAAMGSTGRSSGSHLHLEIRVDGVAYNPQSYLY